MTISGSIIAFLSLFTYLYMINKFVPSNFSLRSKEKLPKWVKDIPAISSNHTQVSGILAGFTITVLFLIVGDKYSHAEKIITFSEYTLLGLFLTSFFSYIATGISFSLVLELENNRKFFSFTISSLLYSISIALSFISLTFLIGSLNYPTLVIPSLIMTGGTILGSFLALAIPMILLFFLRIRFLSIIFLLSLVTGIGLFIMSYNYNINTTLLFSLISIFIVLLFSRSMLLFFPSITFLKNNNKQSANIFLTKELILYIYLVYSFLISFILYLFHLFIVNI